jgi:LPS-assembly protein
MTISPRVFTKRGVMLGTEYRFLTSRGSGEIDVEYMPHDRMLDEDRTGVYVSGQSNPLQNVYTNLLVQYVSDDEYLDDFHNKLDLLGDTYLERHLDLLYQGGNWSTLARLQKYQVLDPSLFNTSDDPYDRLPQLLFEGRWPDLSYGLTGRMRGEVVNFQHGQQVAGGRLDLWPALSWPWQTQAGFVTPQVGYRLTAYDLNDTTTAYPSTPTRRTPIVSLDSGLFFERPVAWPWWNEQLDTLTLEPRLFYLYVPYRNQNELPTFDTTLLSPNYSRLFLENRFTGADRMNDANQITTGVTSRLLSSNSGYQQFQVSAGQIYYFEDRQVALQGTAPQSNSRSDLITEGLVNLRRDLTVGGNLQWDVSGAGIRRSGLNVRYRPTSDRLINVAYRLTQHLISEEAPEESEIKQIDVSTLWAMSDRWRTVARWNYSLDTSRNLDTFAGLEYEECCWALRVLARRYRDEPDSELQQEYFVELELRGLSQVGNKRITRFLEEAIQGYQPRSVYSPFTPP